MLFHQFLLIPIGNDVVYNSNSFQIHLSSGFISLMLVIIKIVLLKLLLDETLTKVI